MEKYNLVSIDLSSEEGKNISQFGTLFYGDKLWVVYHDNSDDVDNDGNYDHWGLIDI